MKAVGVLTKELTTSRRKFHERGRDESFDGKLEKLRLVLNNIKDVFVEMKKNEEKLLDTLASVYDHLHRLDRKKLHQDMHSICKRIRDSARNLVPTLVFDNRGGKISHSSEELNLEVLQLGRWQDSPLHHIEVGSEEFLRELRTLKQLKYLSLRGISRIFELPSSIAELESLVILDLKACHNLERLPDDISSMKSLTQLIMSDCCLLEGMPKGIEKLTNLQVLKGFLITTSEKTPCRLSDLVEYLRKLRRLSIRIGSEALIRDGEFESLGSLLALKHLKISWSVSEP
ncbi:hypothetical protein V8G54_018389, partial [Vigna mungo]